MASSYPSAPVMMESALDGLSILEWELGWRTTRLTDEEFGRGEGRQYTV